jgi:hypothetical protein
MLYLFTVGSVPRIGARSLGASPKGGQDPPLSVARYSDRQCGTDFSSCPLDNRIADTPPKRSAQASLWPPVCRRGAAEVTAGINRDSQPPTVTDRPSVG